MEEVNGLPILARSAARSRVKMQPSTAVQVAANELKKGDVLGVARFAGVRAARGEVASLVATSVIASVSVSFAIGENFVDIVVIVVGSPAANLSGRALSGVAAASLTIFDMCKAVDHTMVIGGLSLANEIAEEQSPGA